MFPPLELMTAFCLLVYKWNKKEKLYFFFWENSMEINQRLDEIYVICFYNLKNSTTNTFAFQLNFLKNFICPNVATDNLLSLCRTL